MLTPSQISRLRRILCNRLLALTQLFAEVKKSSNPNQEVINIINDCLQKPLADNEFTEVTFDKTGIYSQLTLTTLKNELRGLFIPNYKVYFTLKIINDSLYQDIKIDEPAFEKIASDFQKSAFTITLLARIAAASHAKLHIGYDKN